MKEETTLDSIIQSMTNYGLKVIAAIVILVVGLWIAKRIKGLFAKFLEKKEIDPTLVGFLSNIIHGAIVIFVLVAAIGKLGVETTSFAAVVASAGLAIGLALQGSLSNFAAGVLLILFKPFKVGHAIKVGGEIGIVVEVGLLTTELKSPDNVKLVMPNSIIMSGAITNFSANPTRRIDLTIGVGYGDDLNKAQKLILDLITSDDRILKDPEPQVLVSNLGESSVDFVVRPWVDSADFWTVKCDLTKKIKEKFDAEGINIPFPQRDIHVFQEKLS